jgi:pectin methylesterase-like acyl-CoA thioesterase
MGTFDSYTMKVDGNDIVVENLTISNTAGEVGQAVALHIEGDRCVFRNCRFLGNQDTMFASGENSRQYYKDCYIEGTTDFIFGPATAVFEDCLIHSKRDSYITAASTPEWVDYGYVFIDCKCIWAGRGETMPRQYLSGLNWETISYLKAGTTGQGQKLKKRLSMQSIALKVPVLRLNQE